MMRFTVLALVFCALTPSAQAALYQKINGQFVQMSAADEATARSDPNNLIGNDSGYPVLLGASEASELKSFWAAGAADAVKQAAQAQYAALIAGGLTIASTGTPTLNGTYAIDSQTRANIDGIYAGIKGGDGLPGGGATFVYRDKAGSGHTFDAASFTNFAKAVRDYLYALSQGQTPTLPVTIP